MPRVPDMRSSAQVDKIADFVDSSHLVLADFSVDHVLFERVVREYVKSLLLGDFKPFKRQSLFYNFLYGLFEAVVCGDFLVGRTEKVIEESIFGWRSMRQLRIWKSFLNGAAQNMRRGVPENVLFEGINRLDRTIVSKHMTQINSSIVTLRGSLNSSKHSFRFLTENLFRSSRLTKGVNNIVQFDVNRGLSQLCCFCQLFKES